mgnify:CR=1 FL=1
MNLITNLLLTIQEDDANISKLERHLNNAKGAREMHSKALERLRNPTVSFDEDKATPVPYKAPDNVGRMLLTEDNANELEEGDIIAWEVAPEVYGDVLTIMKEYVVSDQCNDGTHNPVGIDIDDSLEDYKYYPLYSHGAVCYKIIK